MAIVQAQQRMRELGRIRTGEKSAKGAPTKLDRFRLTSASETLIRQVAAAYGGQARPWQTPDGRAQFEVITDAARIPILLPPQPVSQWMELWSGGGCLRRCTGEREILTDSDCICKVAEEELCKPTTRLNVMLRDLPGLGVWRLESHGWNAAQELPATALFAAQANGMIPAWLTLEERVSKKDGKTHRYMVPGIDVDVTPAQLLAGEGVIGAPAIGQAASPAIEAVPVESGGPWPTFAELIDAAPTRDELLAIRADVKDSTLTAAQKVALDVRMTARAAELGVGAGQADDPAATDSLWLQIVGSTPFDTTQELEDDFFSFTGDKPDEATPAQMRSYLAEQTARAEAAKAEPTFGQRAQAATTEAELHALLEEVEEAGSDVLDGRQKNVLRGLIATKAAELGQAAS